MVRFNVKLRQLGWLQIATRQCIQAMGRAKAI